MKAIIIGNSGSGKTWLAERLAEGDLLPVVHLDDIFWEPGGFNERRPNETVLQLVDQAKSGHCWIVEGVFGELAEHFLEQADYLVWLDIDLAICQERLNKRGSESKQHMGREESEEGLSKLLEWAGGYYDRTDLRSHSGHELLFQRFAGKKILIKSPDQVNVMIRDAQQNSAAVALGDY